MGSSVMWNSFLIVAASLAFKMLFMFSYRSTDFEVHRNWMAIAHSLPLSKWYFESTSQWTLDYPPLFAWFEWILSQFAVLIDPAMCVISNLPYISSKTIVFQRCSVIFTEFILFYALWRLFIVLSSKGCRITKRRFLLMLSTIAFNFGLIVIDHIHFQYNGFLLGLLILATSFLMEERFLCASGCFTCLLFLKHIFLYIAPVYFVFILFNYCFVKEKGGASLSLARLCKVSSIVICVAMLSMLPFLKAEQLRQIHARLFPFDRGLTHAYWAPNFWALYNTLDRVMHFSSMRVATLPNVYAMSTTRGLVGEVAHLILPSIRPWHTWLLSFCGMLPHLVYCAKEGSVFRPTSTNRLYVVYLEALVGVAWSCFLFGWHVHEKAVLMILLPLNLLAFASPVYSELAFYMTTIGHFSLIPLIPTAAEAAAVVFTFLAYTSWHWLVLFRMLNPEKSRPASRTNRLLGTAALLHLYGLPCVYTCCFIIWPWTSLAKRLPFLPLMITSAYCAVGHVMAFIFYLQFGTRAKLESHSDAAPEETLLKAETTIKGKVKVS